MPGSFGLEIGECASEIVSTDDAGDDDGRWDHPSWHRTLGVKKAYETGESVTSIARRFSVSRQTVYNDIRRTAPITHHRKRSPSASRRKVNRWIDRIRQLYEVNCFKIYRQDVWNGGRNILNSLQQRVREERLIVNVFRSPQKIA
ncbi:helix-turn-helix domain-containing protein [Exiguobacterium algae]|uniref:helix-turn-helix domain-containing protein n=1 Tax=Exiguobacterium algae TaxID=2751250 RepID=UPI001BE8729C